ncbi:hypothetical protein Tco_1226077 [Tanacetum coccineum]
MLPVKGSDEFTPFIRELSEYYEGMHYIDSDDLLRDIPFSLHELAYGNCILSRHVSKSFQFPSFSISRWLLSRVPLMGEEFEAFEPSGTRTVSSHSLDSTAPLSARIVEATALSPSFFRKRYRSSYETSSSSSPTLPTRKRYQVTFELILDTNSEGDELGKEENEEDESSDADDERVGQVLDYEGHGLEDEGPGIEEEDEVAPEGQQQPHLVVDTAASEPLGIRYGALRCRELALRKGSVPNTFEVGQSSRSLLEREGSERVSAFRQPTFITWVDPEDGRVYTDIPAYVPLGAPVQTPPSLVWSSGSLPVSPSSLVVPSPIASLVATPTTTILVDEDQFLEVGAQLELHGSILHDHTQRLDALPPVLPPYGVAVARPALHVIILGGIIYTREDICSVR